MNLNFSKICVIYLISFSQNYVTFLSKTGKFVQVIFSDFETSAIKCDIFEPALNQFLKFLRHMESVIIVFSDKWKSYNWQSYVKNLFSKFHHKFQKILQKIDYLYNTKKSCF